MVQLFRLLNKRAASEILELFLKSPGKQLYEKEIRETLRLSRASTIKWLRVLEENELLHLTRLGRMKYYKLNADSPVTRHLKILLNISLVFPEVKSLKGKCKIFLYGSAARGEDTENSDIDLLVLGRQSPDTVTIIRNLERRLKKRIRPTYYTEVEWSKLSRKDTAFYERVEKDKIELV